MAAMHQNVDSAPARTTGGQAADAPTPTGMGVRARHLLIRWLRTTAGLALGAVTGLVEVVFLLLAGVLLLPALPWPRRREVTLSRVAAWGRGLTKLETWRLRTFLDADSAEEYGDRRGLTYLLVRCLVGLLGGLVLALLAAGLVLVEWTLVRMLTVGIGWGVLDYVFQGTLGLVLLFLNLQGIAATATLDRRTARQLLGPSARELLQRRITQLAVSRSDVVDAVDDERRRIERDLHDGVQQRLVALGMLLGRARRNPDHDDLLRQAHQEAQEALRDLREVAWRVYPTALDNGGLRPALEAVAEHAALPVRIQDTLTTPLTRQAETVVYFLVAEAVTNAAKHAGAEAVTVELTGTGGRLTVRVTDDGHGGADPDGGGLSGLARRVAALDGRFTVDSPPGGPTTVAAELPLP